MAAKWSAVDLLPVCDRIAISCCRPPAIATPSRHWHASALPALHMVCKRKANLGSARSAIALFHGRSEPKLCETAA